MTTIQKMAALGSSYAAGPGIDPVVKRSAMRSGRNYAHVAAARLGAELVDLTVSGATTDTILDTPQRVLLQRVPPQLAGLPADADLVTITASGNDLGYLSSALKLGIFHLADRIGGGRLSRGRTPKLPTVGADDVEAATVGLTRVAIEAARRAPSARVLLVDYLPMVGPATGPAQDVPFSDAAIASLSTIHDQLAEIFAEAAQRSNVDLLQASTLGRGHELGSDEPWIQPMQPLHRIPASFHPNAAGMAAVGEAVCRHLGL